MSQMNTNTSIEDAIRDPSVTVVRQLTTKDMRTFQRSNSSPIVFNMGKHVPLVRSNPTAQASQTMRQDFLEQAIRKDNNGTIHVEDFMNLLTAPVPLIKWVPNTASDGCQRCKKTFSLVRRRHHCRYCGLLVCSKCSQARVVFRPDSLPVRVCLRCMCRIVGRIDALYNRRYMRAVISNNNINQSSNSISLSLPSSPASETTDFPQMKKSLSFSSNDFDETLKNNRTSSMDEVNLEIHEVVRRLTEGDMLGEEEDEEDEEAESVVIPDVYHEGASGGEGGGIGV